jgi:hypothetical protein
VGALDVVEMAVVEMVAIAVVANVPEPLSLLGACSYLLETLRSS